MGIEPTPSAWKAEVLPLNYTRQTHFCCTDYLVEGGGFTPGIMPSALRAAALRATFEIAPGDFVNLHRFTSSPRKRERQNLTSGGGGRI
jgi:hypothetical protein